MTINVTYNMEDYPIPVVTPPLIDPLTEAANAHMAAMAEAEASEAILKESGGGLNNDPETETGTKSSSETTSSSSASSLHDPENSLHKPDDPILILSPEDIQPLVPTLLVEEYKEPGVYHD
jgi:hypothetical protein